MTKVYVWPAGIGGAMLYGDPTRIRATVRWDGAPAQKVEQQQRSTIEVSGDIVRDNADDFDIMLDRLSGGQNLVGLWDMDWRLQAGWDSDPALNSSGAEFWRANGHTSLYAGESANPPSGPWRSIFAAANGAAAAGAASIAIDGLLANEVIPKGGMIRIGDHRHRVLTAATANASGEVTLSLARTLRGAVANNAQVRIPGDFVVGSLVGREISPSDTDGLRNFRLVFVEVYESELADSTVSPTELFEYVVD